MRNCRSNLLIFLLSFVRCWVTCGSNLIVPLRAAVVSVCFSLGVASSILCSPIREWEANSSDSSPVGSKLPALIGLDSTSSQKGQFPGPQRLMMPQNPVIPRRFLHLFPTNLRGHVATLWWLPTLAMLRTRRCFGIVAGGHACKHGVFLVATHFENRNRSRWNRGIRKLCQERRYCRNSNPKSSWYEPQIRSMQDMAVSF